ncbi:10042_t:CDS:1, partial [Ambispora leptoticha]
GKNKKELRAYASNFSTQFQCVLEAPYNVRDEAVNNLLKAYKSNYSILYKSQVLKDPNSL